MPREGKLRAQSKQPRAIEYGENQVGSKVKVWSWTDLYAYEEVIESICSVKKKNDGNWLILLYVPKEEEHHTDVQSSPFSEHLIFADKIPKFRTSHLL